MKKTLLGFAVVAITLGLGIRVALTARADSLLSTPDEAERLKMATVGEWKAAREEAKIDWSRFVYITSCIKDRRGENAVYYTTEVHPGGERVRRCLDGWVSRMRQDDRILDVSIMCGHTECL